MGVGKIYTGSKAAELRVASLESLMNEVVP
jgi:hypothetical protein